MTAQRPAVDEAGGTMRTHQSLSHASCTSTTTIWLRLRCSSVSVVNPLASLLGNEHPAAHEMHEIAFDSLFYARFQGGVFGGPFSLRLCSGQRCEGDHLGR